MFATFLVAVAKYPSIILREPGFNLASGSKTHCDGKAVDSPVQAGQSLVTASYILPEQVEKRAISREGSLLAVRVHQLGIMHIPKFPQLPDTVPLAQSLTLEGHFTFKPQEHEIARQTNRMREKAG